MATNRSKRHVHKYHQILLNATPIWACALPDCNHYMPKHLEDMVPGKASVCWECGEKMILDIGNMREKNPRCLNCLGSAEESIPLSHAMTAYLDSKV